MLSLLIIVVVAALLFDFINGFHDAANAIATSVSTGVMSVRTAVVVSGICNFLGALAGTAVAGFIAKGLADAEVVTQQVVLAALIGASAWNLITWWYGIPSSSSHALMGGLCGAVTAHAGSGACHWQILGEKVLLPLVLSPVLGFAVAFLLMLVSLWLFRRARTNTVNVSARYLQLASACTLSFSHGSNDAQKAMGVITLSLVAFMIAHGVKPLVTTHGADGQPELLVAVATFDGVDATGTAKDIEQAARTAHDARIAASTLPSWMKDHQRWLLPTSHVKKDKPTEKPKEHNDVPLWTIYACALAMALGTLAGGKKIIKTMGSKIIKISPLQGFAAQSSGTAVILCASSLGIPVSTTHCITASVMGAGLSKGLAAVRWGMARNILIAWILTLPASGLAAWVMLWLLELLFGV